MEVAFEEARRHLGVESQRQWSDLAIERTTPVLLGLFSWVTLVAEYLRQSGAPIQVRRSAWYGKGAPTFSDALAQVRLHLWQHRASFLTSDRNADLVNVHRDDLDSLIQMACYAA